MNITVRETAGLVLMLIGIGLISATVKAASPPWQSSPPIRFDPSEVRQFEPIQPPLRCPLRVMVTRPLDLNGEEWVFAVPTSCRTA